MRSIVIALLAYQLGHLSRPAPAPVVVLPAAPVVVAPAPPHGRWIRCTCNNPCGDCLPGASNRWYFDTLP